MDAHHDEVHEDEVHCSARGHFGPQLFHRSGPVVRGEEGGVGEGAGLLALDQPSHHLDVQRRVILQHTYIKTHVSLIIIINYLATQVHDNSY